MNNLIDSRSARLVGSLAILCIGVVCAVVLTLPSHLVLDSGSHDHPIGAVTSKVEFVQEVAPGERARITAVAVLLATNGKAANETHDELRVLDSGGRVLQRASLPPGSVKDNAYVRLEFTKPLSLAEAGKIFIALSSSDGTPSNSITAWAASVSAFGQLYELPKASGGALPLGQRLTHARRQNGALCVQVYGLDPKRLAAEAALKVMVILASLVAAACFWYWRVVRRVSSTLAAEARSIWTRVTARYDPSALSRIERRLSEDHLIRFDLRVQILCVIAAVTLLMLAALMIHGSSVEMWNTYLPSDQGDTSSLLLGAPKAVRADEWMVSTPQLLSRYTRPGGPTASTMALDVVRPWNWGFYLAGIERGFAFRWDFWLIGSVVAFFFLMMLLTANRFGLSLCLAFLILLSSYNRWWDITAYTATFGVVLTSLLVFLQSKKRLNVAIAFVALCVFGVEFITRLYPAWQVPLAYLIVFVVIGYAFRRGFWNNLRTHLRLKVVLAIGGLAMLVAGALVGYGLYQKTIETMMGTVYPGKRVSGGGDAGYLYFFSGFLDPFFNELHYFWLNICESSSFIMLFPFVIGAMVIESVALRKRKVDPLVVALVTYLILLSAYAMLGFGTTLSSLVLLNYVPGTRSLIGVGIASFMLAGVYLAQRQRSGVAVAAKWILVVVAFCLLLGFAVVFRTRFPGPTWVASLPVCLALSLAVAALVFRKTFIFSVILLVLLAVPSWNSNPVSAGLAPVYGKRLVQAVEAIAKSNPHDRWLVYGDMTTPQVVKAAGGDVFNGSCFPPDVELMRRLDPTAANEQVWNRYAVIVCQPSDGRAVRFSLRQPDLYTLWVDPADPRLAQAGIRLFAAPASMQPRFPAGEFEALAKTPLNGYVLFKRIGPLDAATSPQLTAQ